MADRTSTRSTSRRTTPQPRPESIESRSMPSLNPPQRTTRITRSQSHDVSDSEASRTGAAKRSRRRGARQVSADAVEDTGRNSGRNKPRIEPSTHREMQDLATVIEDDIIVYPDLPLSVGNEVDLDTGLNRNIQRRSIGERSLGDASVFSGTTARTSRSAQELLGLDAEDMLDALPDLSDTSDKLLRVLAPPDPSDAAIRTMRNVLKNSESRMSKKFKRLCDTFQIPRKLFGNSLYIHRAAVLRTFLGEIRIADVTYGPWRPDPLLQKANLCKLLMTTLNPSGSVESDQTIEELDQIFPTPFLHSFVSPELLVSHAGSSALREDTLKLGLDLRTQYAIMLLTRNLNQDNFDPDTVLYQVFYQARDRLNGWNLTGMRAEEFPEEFEDMVTYRLSLIRQSFPNDPQASRTGQLVDIEHLESNFPREGFVNEVVAWSRARLNELQRQINIVEGDGAENIRRALEHEVHHVSKTYSRIENNTNVHPNSPTVELNYETTSELTRAPTESIETSRQPITSINKLKPSGISFNSPSALPHTINHLRERFERRPDPFMVQEAPVVPPIVHVAGTAPSGDRPLISSKKVEETTISSSAPVSMADGLGPRVQIEHDVPWEGDAGEPEEDYAAGTKQIMETHAQLEAESNHVNLAQDSVRSSNPVFRHPPQQQPQAMQKRRLLDHQPNAERVHWESQETAQSDPSNDCGDPIRIVDVDDVEDEEDQIEEPSQDVGFQIDTRPVDVVSRRGTKPSNNRPVAERVDNVPRAQKRARQASETQSSRKRSTATRRTVEPDEEDDMKGAVRRHNGTNAPPPTQLENFKKANSENKLRKSDKTKKPQSRKAWTDKETEALIELISEHGTSWALLKTIDEKSGGNKLASRDQVALKDKARNMKLDFLKASTHLPPHFERIPLNRLQITTLRSLGLRYNSNRGTLADGDSDATEPDE